MTNTQRMGAGGRLGLAWAAGAALALAGASAMAQQATGGGSSDNFGYLPNTLSLDATIRDFKAKGTAGGHNDFQAYSGTTTVGLVQTQLDQDGKPVAASLRGQRIDTEFRDRNGKNIMPSSFNQALGDVRGSLSAGPTSNGLTSANEFAQWFRDVPGVNVSKVVPLTLNRVPNTNRYVFDSATDEPYKSRGGFFPINGELYGNSGTNSAGLTGNFHFTTEVSTEFVYERGQNQAFTFTGDDDVWVFIDGKLVIDLGGLHSKKEQTLNLDRLTWLENGRLYSLKVFHAERRTNQSNFRIETTLKLRSVEPPATSGAFD